LNKNSLSESVFKIEELGQELSDMKNDELIRGKWCSNKIIEKTRCNKKEF
jgi:hypothetical protein